MHGVLYSRSCLLRAYTVTLDECGSLFLYLYLLQALSGPLYIFLCTLVYLSLSRVRRDPMETRGENGNRAFLLPS